MLLILININNTSLKNQDFILNLLFCPGESRIVFFYLANPPYLHPFSASFAELEEYFRQILIRIRF